MFLVNSNKAGETIALPDYIVWPRNVLEFSAVEFTKQAFVRSGGRSLQGIERTTKSDRGFWRASLGPVRLYTKEEWRTWQAIDTFLGGRAGYIAVPAFTGDDAPYPNGVPGSPTLGGYSETGTFSDGGLFRTRYVDVKLNSAAAISDTSVTLEIVNAASDLVGVKFSYQHALYETGPVTSISGNLWTVPVFPAIRAPIPAGASLEFDEPTCLMKLASDDEMSVPHGSERLMTGTLNFVEAVDYWTDLALA